MRKALLISILALLAINVQAVNDGDNDSIRFMKKFAGWTEEQILAYEDSLINALTPPNTVIERPDTTSSRTQAENREYQRAERIQNSIVPDYVTIDTSKGVGQIDIETGFTPTGARTYNVPIKSYSVDGFPSPEISLLYNSQAGNGIAGMGWTISGLSSITRGGKSVYYDGKTDAVRMTKDDSFWLDGIRLIRLATYTDSIKYQSEQGNIIAYAYRSSNVIKYFRVHYPDGTTATYGYTTNTTSRVSYPLTSRTDLRGNTVSYSYSLANNSYCVTGISYNCAQISFAYQTGRPDPVSRNIGGLVTRETRRLSSITCSFAGTVIGTYSLTYETKDGFSMLSQIGYTAGGTALNPLVFYYGTHATTETYTSVTSQAYTGYEHPENCVLVSGKFSPYEDTDGLAVYPYCLSYWRFQRPGGTWAHAKNHIENKYTGNEEICIYTHSCGIFANLSSLTTGTGFIDLLSADIYGEDGQHSIQDECLIRVNNVVSGSNDRVTFNVYRRNVMSGISLAFSRTFDFPTIYTDNEGVKSIMPKYYYTGDFNGDGKTDVLAVSVHNPFGETTHPSKCYVFDLVNNSIIYNDHVFDFNVTFFSNTIEDPDEVEQNSDKLYVVDHDGDGKSEICLVDTTGMHIYTFDVSAAGTMTPRLLGTYAALSRSALDNKKLVPADVNGDGLTDFLLSPSKNEQAIGQWNGYESKGKGTFYAYTLMGPSGNPNCRYIVQDVNSDGRSDLIEVTSYFISTYLTADRSMSYTNGISITPTTNVSQVDINSWNYFTRLASIDGQGHVIMYSFNKNELKDLLLTGMANSLGIVEKNDYVLTTEGNPAVYQHGSDALFPYVNFTGPVGVLAATEKYMGGSRIDYSYCRYSNAVYHRRGLGFCGFGEVTATDIRGDESSSTYDPYRFGVLTAEDSKYGTSEYEYTINVASNKTRKVNLVERSDYDRLKGITSDTEISYDTYGFPTTQTTTIGNSTITVTNTYQHNNSGTDGYYLGLLKQRTNQKVHNGVTYTEKNSIVSFNAMNLPKDARTYINNNLTSKTTYTYDGNGRKLTETFKPYSSTNGRTTTWQYDTYGRQTSETDPLGLTTSYTYNNKGWIATKTDPFGTTGYTYDPFGRITNTLNPDSTTLGIAFAWTGPATNICFKATETGTVKPTTTTTYDALGREIKSSLAQIGSTTYTDRTYDSYGNLASVSAPYIASATLYTTYEYDDYDRLEYMTEPSGRITEKSYSGLSETTTVGSKSVTRNYDVLGYLTSVVDPAGTVTYVPSADGQPVTIVAPGGVSTTFTYDVYRRRSSINDPSQGTTSFTYDSQGNVSRETFADNRYINYTYDMYGRLTGKSSSEFSTAYNYNSLNLLTSEVSTNGTSKTYTYDALGRISSSTDNAPDGKWLRKDFTYAGGRVSEATYTSQTGQLATEKYTYSNGYLQKIGVGDSVYVYHLQNTNMYNYPTQVKSGNITKHTTYSNTGLLTSIKASLTSKAFIQNFSYTFDPITLNLSSRTDAKRSITENFTYDTLDRLTAYGSNTVQYDVKGNITSKSDVGTYTYGNSSKPYAVTEVNQSGSAIPARAQDVTYTSFWRPATISENGYTASFTYNGGEERVRMRMRYNGTTSYTRYYLGGCYELDSASSIKERLYLGGDYYTAPAVLVKTSSGTNIYYILRDHLGSITRIYKSDNTLLQERSYDAWGRMRNPSTQTVYAPGNEPSLYLGRGYTGHEYLKEFGLVNMNARLYDPALGRFLSPDPLVQDSEDSQNYNRYSYCLNNPLSYVDLTGETFYYTYNTNSINEFLWAKYGGKGYLNLSFFDDGPWNIFNDDGLYPMGALYYDDNVGKYFWPLQGNDVDWMYGHLDMDPMKSSMLQGTGGYIGPKGGRKGNQKSGKSGGYRDSSKTSSTMSAIHTTLDAVGLIPGFDAADLINAGIYLLEGDYINAGISAAAMIPVVGGVATAAKVANKTEKAVKMIERNGVKVYDGMVVTSSEALEMADKFLGKGYKDGRSGFYQYGRYLSADGKGVVRLATNDILGLHAGGSHFNFGKMVPNPAKPNKDIEDSVHVFLKDVNY